MTTRRTRLLCVLISLAAVLAVGASEDPPQRRTPARRPPSRTACGCAHACSPATYQGCGCGSIACFPGGNRLQSLTTDDTAKRALATLVAPAPCEGGLAAGTFPCVGTTLQSYLSLDQLNGGAASGSSLWGFVDADDGREYAVVGVSNGTAVVDVTDPVAPVVVGSIPGVVSFWREVKTSQVWNPSLGRHNAYAYVVTEGTGGGVQILDLSELPAHVTLASTYRAFDTAHTVFLAHVDPATGIANVTGVPPVLYLQGARNPTAGIVALDISNPVAPSLLGTYTASYGHDIWAGAVSGERAAACAPGHDPCEIVVNWAGDAIRILDWTEKETPLIIGELAYEGLGFAHSGWISANGRYLFSMDEFDERQSSANSSVRVLDVSDWANPRVVAQWMGTTRAIEHNGYTKGDRFYMASYERGLVVLDVSNPLAPREVAFLDTYPASNQPAFHGAWGTYPYLPSGNVVVSALDGAGGFWVIRESAHVNPLRPRPRLSNRSRHGRP